MSRREDAEPLPTSCSQRFGFARLCANHASEFLSIGHLASSPKFLSIGHLASSPKFLLIGRLACPKFYAFLKG